MGKLTENLPKPMLPLAGKPMLEHIVERLNESGVRDILIVTGYRAETIETHFGNWPGVVFRRQEPIDGTATAALLGREFAASDAVLFTFGDILVDPQDYRGISAKLFESEETQAATGVKWVQDPWQGAAVYEEAGRVVRIVEKPPKGTSATHWNSAGLYAFRHRLFRYLARVERSDRGEFEFTSAVEMLLAAGERVALYPIRGEWRDVGRPEDIAPAQDIVD
jgi:dTDP-glucose pyrophosphorylase